jgi:hypothetical protein
MVAPAFAENALHVVIALHTRRPNMRLCGECGEFSAEQFRAWRIEREPARCEAHSFSAAHQTDTLGASHQLWTATLWQNPAGITALPN